jgi:uncharacterized Zn finger protein (UPF0148 family)
VSPDECDHDAEPVTVRAGKMCPICERVFPWVPQPAEAPPELTDEQQKERVARVRDILRSHDGPPSLDEGGDR